ncbi:hypothetical protein GBA63_09510 [Rubrobacter tropicus]|uniref:SCP domain-containing protein n=1 Tax=Rubrobacter tropicus TaxID=2653851 RepID=A0A6G8Q8V5_9ACTN|nr:CAP domain-containing protein [Rubrobacter tropicus]QIN82858.1 hypothetical protein GBA63_09510 [Rubrobacter tropicus]
MQIGIARVILAGMEMMRTTPKSARATRHRWWVLVLITVLLSTLVLTGRGDASTAYDSEELQFLGLINDYRKENGLRPLLLSDTLTVSSERHSEDMADYGFFAHNTEKSSYYPAASEPWDRMEAEGYRYNTAKGENLAVGYETAEEAMKAWQESPSHNEAMLDGNYRVMGVARINAPGSVHGWYWTTDFGGHVDPSAHAAGESPDPEKQAPKPADKPATPPTAPAEESSEPFRDTNELENGAMGKLGVWSQRARDGADLVLQEGYARLGGYHDGVDELRQRIRVGEDSRLAYDLKIRTGGDQPADRMAVRLTDGQGKTLAVLEEYTGREAVAWERERVDLSRFADRTLFLSFHAQTNGDGITTFQVDKVSLAR